MASSAFDEAPRTPVDGRTAALVGTALFIALAAAGLAWAKWIPYVEKLSVTDITGAYPGHDLLAQAGAPGSAPSFAKALTFTKAYAIDIWPALLVALVVSASIEALLPRGWMLQALGDGGLPSRMRAGLISLPCMMCTCCSAPVVVTLRRKGAPLGTVLSYWLGNPVLNPAVLAFLAIVLPWQWVLTRIVVGSLLVFLLTGLVARLMAGHERGRRSPRTAPAPEQLEQTSQPAGQQPASALEGRGPGQAGRRFALALLRLAVLLLPEYLIVVFAVGLLRGWLLPIGDTATHLALLFTVLAAIAGTLVVIPTAGEIPLIGALLAAGVGAGPLGALLIALPAISLPSMAMVSRAIGWRTTSAMAVAVAGSGILSGVLLWALGG